MSLPKFNESGDLPEGIHSATLDETIARFGSGTAKREEVIGVTQLGRGIMERGRPGRSWVGALWSAAVPAALGSGLYATFSLDATKAKSGRDGRAPYGPDPTA